MEHDILYRPSYSLLCLGLSAGESIVANGGAMVSMSPGLEVVTASRGGFLRALARKLFGGQTFFQNTFTAATVPGEVTLAPVDVGDIFHLSMKGRPVLVQTGSFLASTGDLTVSTRWGGWKAFFSGEGFFLLEVGGHGDLFLCCYGGMYEIDVNGSYVVDTGHIVAFDPGLDYSVRTVGGFKSTLLSGEGLVTEFRGVGKLYLQTRTRSSLVGWIAPMLRS